MNILKFSPDDISSLPPVAQGLPSFDMTLIRSQHCDEHWVGLDEAGCIVAHCSLWWSRVPNLPGERLGVIGHYGAVSGTGGAPLLRVVLERLVKVGVTRAVGPLNGNTWNSYRFVTEHGTEPPFFMEPANPDEWPRQWKEAGFEPLAQYSSSLALDLEWQDPRVEAAEKRLENSGVTIRQLKLDQYESELRQIYELSRTSFTRNFLYTELALEEFLALYLPYRDKIESRLVLIAEREGNTVGYLFAVPDYGQVIRGQKINTVIGKTVAVLPGKMFGGLGLVLTGRLHRIAFDHGYTRVIHALQHESNSVRKMSDRFGQIMRRYTLYHRILK